MKKYILLFIFIVILNGCETKNQEGTEVKSDTMAADVNSRLIPVIYKGMYIKTNENGVMTECGSGKNFLISKEGEIAAIDSVYNKYNRKNPGKKIYINVEGFSSVQQKVKKNVFDTVVVITRIIGTDTTFNCEN